MCNTAEQAAGMPGSVVKTKWCEFCLISLIRVGTKAGLSPYSSGLHLIRETATHALNVGNTQTGCAYWPLLKGLFTEVYLEGALTSFTQVSS